jgi:hypothetical protein
MVCPLALIPWAAENEGGVQPCPQYGAALVPGAKRFVGAAVCQKASIVAALGVYRPIRHYDRARESDLAHMNRLSLMGELAASLIHESHATGRNCVQQ